MKFTVLIFVILLVIACDDVFDQDLTSAKVKLISPSNNSIITDLTNQFWWEEFNNVEFNLQIASPTFKNPSKLWVDTVISDNKFIYTLNPGKFEWRVRAINESSKSGFSTHSLFIDTTTDLSNQTLLLKLPLNSSINNKSTITFSWFPLHSAMNYRLQIAKPAFSTSQSMTVDTLISMTSFSTNLPEGNFEWRASAINATSSTAFNNAFSLIVDTTAPDPSEITFPLNNDYLTGPYVSLSWQRDQLPQLTPIQGDSVFIYSDSLQTYYFQPFYSESTSFQDTFATGIYFWRIKTFDKAGNGSKPSTPSKFIIQ